MPLDGTSASRRLVVPDYVDAAFLSRAPWRRLLVLGDSVAAGFGDPVDGYRARTWPARLKDALEAGGTRVASLNLGVPGKLAATIRAEQLNAALHFRADLAVMSAGGNDILRRSAAMAEVAADVDVIVGSLSRQGALVVTFGLFDLSLTRLVPEEVRPDLRRRIADLNDTVRTISASHGGVHVDFFGDPARDESLISADQIHPNHRGQAHMAARVVRALADDATGCPSRPDLDEPTALDEPHAPAGQQHDSTPACEDAAPRLPR